MADHDDELRERFRQVFTRPHDAGAALTALKPVMTRARRRRQVRTGASAAAIALVFASGAGAMTSRGDAPPVDPPAVAIPPAVEILADPSTTVTTTIGPHESATTDQPAARPTTPGGAPLLDAELTTTTPPVPRPTPTPPAVSPTSTVDRPNTGPPTPTQSAVTTTVSPGPTATTPPAPVTIDSSCGSIVVQVEADTVTLLSVQADPGMAVDVKNDGPEEVEVSLEGPTGHCEIKAEVRDGQLSIDVDDE